MIKYIQRYAHGWSIFYWAYRKQRTKKHGKGQRDRITAIYNALCARWIVDGQWRGASGPNLELWFGLKKRFG